MNKFLTPTLLLLISLSCEYERLDPLSNCVLPENAITIDNVTITDSECTLAIGSITIDASSASGPLEYSLNGNGFSTSSTFPNLQAGTYDLSIRNPETGCILDSAGLIVKNSNGVNLLGVETTVAGCGTLDGSIKVNVSDQVGQVTYSIPGVGSQVDNPVFSGLGIGTYTVTAVDAEGCEVITNPIEILSGISFSENIVPIIRANCQTNSSCHVSGGVSPNFDSENVILNRSERIRARTSAGTMPPRRSLSQDLIDDIVCWANDGALAN